MTCTRERAKNTVTRLTSCVLWLGFVLGVVLGGSEAQANAAAGIQLESGAQCLFGTPSRCTKPATVDYKRLRNTTSEWREIKSQGVRPGSGRHSLLMSAIEAKIRKACTKVAKQLGYDCIVRRGDIRDARGLSVGDLTKRVRAELR